MGETQNGPEKERGTMRTKGIHGESEVKREGDKTRRKGEDGRKKVKTMRGKREKES